MLPNITFEDEFCAGLAVNQFFSHCPLSEFKYNDTAPACRRSCSLAIKLFFKILLTCWCGVKCYEDAEINWSIFLS